MAQPIIPNQKSIIPACDVSTLEHFERIVMETSDLNGIGAYKLGFQLVIPYGLHKLVEIARTHNSLPIIYDHQKAGNDIPDMGRGFSDACHSAGVDAVIIFPFAGPATGRGWIMACQDKGLGVIVGGHMTQPNFLESEGGFISDSAPKRMYEMAVELGVKDFVVPGNRVELVAAYRRFFEDLGISSVLYAPGFIAQGGKITDCGRVAGERWHAIVGSAIYSAKDIRATALQLTEELTVK